MSSQHFFTIRCGPCYGIGHHEDKAACQVCNGDGLISLPGNVEDYMICAGCAGSGFCGFDYHSICVRCLGAGKLKKQSALASSAKFSRKT